jgi:PAS domain S-box-containing protein
MSGRVLLAGLTPEDIVVPGEGSTADPPFVECLATDDVAERAAEDEELIVAVLGPELDAPLRIAEQIRFRCEHLPLMIVADSQDVERLGQAVRSSPFLGATIPCLDVQDKQSIRGSLDALIAKARLATRHRGMVAFAQQSLGMRAQSSRPAGRVLDRLLTLSPVGVVLLDREGRLEGLNERACSILGAHEREAVGRPLDRFLAEDSRAVLREALADPDGGRQAAPRVVRTAAPEEGAVLELQARRLEEDIFMVVLHDVTQRHRAEQELRSHRDQLEELVAQRTEELRRQARELRESNEELEQFAYVASHDLQEPLRMVASYCQILERDYSAALDQRGHQFLGYAVEGAKRLQTLVQDLLALSSVGRSEFGNETSSAATVAAAVVEGLSREIAGSGGEVRLGPLPEVPIGTVLLTQLFHNLIGNALKYRSEDPPVIEVRAEREGAFWRFDIEDNGIGVPERFRERIFVIFQRLHLREAAKGNGIGLAICKKIVTRHGGTIRARAREGGGSVFSFTLPASRQDLPPYGAPGGATGGAVGGVV